MRSLYLHVPFCFHKCHYCDFYSIVDPRGRQGAFVDRLERELTCLAPLACGGEKAPLRTVFVGGGTPSLLAVDLWERLLAALHERFDLSAIRAAAGRTGPEAPAVSGGPAEFTVECNPETVTPDLMRTLRAGGVTRVSIGAQSFDRRHLKTLERWHDPANVARAVDLARDSGIARQSVDLIFGIPGQTPAEWEADLDAALSLGTEHLSCYNLTYEPNTAMTARLERGEFQPADEDAEVEMFTRTASRLRAAGLERYEVSNFARAGAECRHNLAYWRQEQWLAAGPSASAHVAGHRWKVVPRLDDYLAHDEDGWPLIVDHEPPDARRALAERLMTGLRLAEGLDRASVAQEAARIGVPMGDLLAAASTHVAGGLLDDSGGRWRLTDGGFLLANVVVGDLMHAVRPSV